MTDENRWEISCLFFLYMKSFFVEISHICSKERKKEGIVMTTEEIIEEMRKLSEAKVLGDKACFCAEAANRLEELQQEVNITRRLEKIRNEKNDLDNQFMRQDQQKNQIMKNVRKPLRSLLKEGRILYVTGFDYDITPCVLEIDEKFLQGSIGDYFVYDLIGLGNGIFIAQIDLSNLILKTWVQKYGCREVYYTLKEKGLL